MRRPTYAAGFLVIATLAGCAASLAPAGWQPVPGSSTAWTSGSGAGKQSYSYVKSAFSGTLQDLASQETTNVVLRYHGAKFVSSDTFAPCPAMGAIEHFTLGRDRIIEEGLSVQNGTSYVLTYMRPSKLPDDPAIGIAMEHALCTAPA